MKNHKKRIKKLVVKIKSVSKTDILEIFLNYFSFKFRREHFDDL